MLMHWNHWNPRGFGASNFFKVQYLTCYHGMHFITSEGRHIWDTNNERRVRQVFALATAKISQYRTVIIIIIMIRKPLVNGFQQQLRSRSSVISPLLKEEKPKIQNVCKDIRGVLDEHLQQKSSLLNPISKYYFDGKVRRLSRPLLIK